MPGQKVAGGNGNEGVHHITQSSRVEASQSDCLVSYPEQSLGAEGLTLL